MGKDLKGKELGKGFYQRKDGRYEAKAMIAGRKIDLYDWNLKLLKQRFTKEKEHIASELEQPFESDLTLNQWFEEWFRVYKVPYIKSASAESMKRRFYGSFGKNLGNMKIRMIRSMDVQHVLNVLQSEGKASSSVKEALGMLTNCLEMACNNQLIVGNPCLNLKVSWDTTKKSTRNAISIEEQKRFLKAADENWYREFVYTLFLTGLRMGEISGLCWKDIDWKNHCIRVHQSLGCEYRNGEKSIQFTALKTVNSYRKIPFMGELKEILLSQKEKQEKLKERLGVRYRAKDEFSNLVFVTSQGSPVTRYSAEKQINLIKNETNIEEMINAEREGREPVLIEQICPHSIRHTFATRCFERGIDPKVVQEMMGHAHYSTTIVSFVELNDATFVGLFDSDFTG